ncbi:MAG: hypothetical protein ACP5R6_01345, partial [Chlorobaculum sp.]
MNQALPERRLCCFIVKTGHDEAAETRKSAVEDRFGTGGQYKHFREAVKQLMERRTLLIIQDGGKARRTEQKNRKQLLPVLICDELSIQASELIPEPKHDVVYRPL